MPQSPSALDRARRLVTRYSPGRPEVSLTRTPRWAVLTALLVNGESDVSQAGGNVPEHRTRIRLAHRFGARYVVAGLLLGIVATGFWLRILDLAAPNFNIDEVLHAFAAQQMLEGHA